MLQTPLFIFKHETYQAIALIIPFSQLSHQCPADSLAEPEMW